MLITLTMVSLAGLTKYDITLTRSWRFCSCNTKKDQFQVKSLTNKYHFMAKRETSLCEYRKLLSIDLQYQLIDRSPD